MNDVDFITELNEKGGEGGLFHGGPSQNVQQAFLASCITFVRPRKVIEIGTHRGNFSFFVKKLLPTVPLTTFGNNPESEKCIEKINEYLNTNIEFVLGDSKKTFAEYNETADLIWVDGGHSYDDALSDLVNCALKNIPFILIDDVSMGDVQLALLEFLKRYPSYKITAASPDVRSTIFITNKNIDNNVIWNKLIGPFLLTVSKSLFS